MSEQFTREQAIALLEKYNQQPFHLEHAYTLEKVLRWYAGNLGYGEDADFWAMAGLLHDIDYEMYPEEHCARAPELLAEVNASDALVHAICSHAYGVCPGSQVAPEHEMEKVLFAVDELTGLIGALVRMLPTKDIQDVQLKSLKKKFKDKKFAAGCSRDVISAGAEKLGWELDKLLQDTITAMQS